MEIIFLYETASTSRSAAEELRQGRTPPFAVIAGTQTGGRGRRGRSWNSPRGGIYLSVVLPPPQTPGALLGNIPLWTGVQTAVWLRKNFGFHAGLKWPNDLMFDGRKLGGILVESGSEGQRQGPVIIGVGINGRQAPDVSDNARETAATDAVALAEICSDIPDVRSLAESLALHLETAWGGADITGAGAAFLDWCPPAMRLFSEPASGRYWLAESVDADGALVLSAVGQPQQQTRLGSVDHQLIPVSRRHPAPVFLADVGNTATKIKVLASFWSDQEYGSARVDHVGNSNGTLAGELLRLAQYSPTHGWPLYIAGVAPAHMSVLAAAAESAGFRPLTVAKRPVMRRGDNYPLNELGIDRMAAIEGCLAGSTGSGTSVIASFGTALTVDVVHGNGIHAGGVIAPGLGLSAKALHEHTGLLPLIDPDLLRSHDSVGHSTHTAIAAGIAGQAAGLIERILAGQGAVGTDRSAPRLVLTGGGAGIAAGWFPQAELAVDLVFRGLQAMTGGGLLPGTSGSC
jgi:BirA family biotin operon repressor/biotin-[acetyl-CoA-carboxylase] ligase